MAVCEFHLSQNNVLGKMTSFMAVVPEGKPGPFPVVYLVHGMSDDHTAWARWTNIERYAQQYPWIIVMPNADRSWYSDAVSVPKWAYETFFTRDLIGFVDSTFQTVRGREGRFVVGQSMGGYGALKLALKHPDLFGAAVSHSGALEITRGRFTGDDERARDLRAVFGEDPTGGPNDLFAIAEKLPREDFPALRMDCGVDDFLIEHNRKFHAHLTALGVAHEYAEHPGAHTWEYWDTHIQDSLAFFEKQITP